MNKNNSVPPRLNKSKRERDNKIFYYSILLFPILQFCIFYVYKNFEMIRMAFVKAEVAVENGIVFVKESFALFANFQKGIEFIGGHSYLLTNSLINFSLVTIPCSFLALIFSYYIYKKYFLSGAFRIILFIPQIVPALIFSLLYRYLVTDGYIALTGANMGLLDNMDTVFPAILFFAFWHGFGLNVLLYTNAMSAINESIVEAAQLDRVNVLQEFIYITFPMIFSTAKSLWIVAISGIITDQLGIHALVGLSMSGRYQTLGYAIFHISSDLIRTPYDGTYMNMYELSAFGVLLTLILTPTVAIVKKLLDKFGPSVE